MPLDAALRLVGLGVGEVRVGRSFPRPLDRPLVVEDADLADEGAVDGVADGLRHARGRRSTHRLVHLDEEVRPEPMDPQHDGLSRRDIKAKERNDDALFGPVHQALDVFYLQDEAHS